MLVGSLDDVSYDLEVDGEEVRRTLHRKVFERGAWATIVMAYEERGPDGWKPAKVVLIRLQKVHDAWKSHGTVTLAAEDARQLADLVIGWNLEHS